MLGFYVAATVVTLLQFLRLRDGRLLALLLLFACAAAARFFECWTVAAHLLDLASGGAGLALVYLLAPRHPNRAASR
jgi:hypothetical protein